MPNDFGYHPNIMANRNGAISSRRRVIWALILVAVLVISIAGSKAIRNLWAPQPAGAVPMRPTAVLWVVLSVIGTFFLIAASAVYTVVLSTGCFTFDYRKFFMPSLGRKLFVANLLTTMLAASGISLIVGPVFATALWELIPGTMAVEVGGMVPMIAALLFFIWFAMWAPLERIVIHRRMRALGVPQERIAMGLPIGTTDPDSKRRKTFAMIVEDDIGLLWFDAEQLLFFGDRGSWSITREQLLSIDRLAHKNAVSSHFGAVHVVLRFRRPDGTEGRIRLHTEGDWTQTARARALDDLADRLAGWQGGARPLPPAMGFAVIGEPAV